MIRVALLALCCLAFVPPAWAEEVSPEGRAFVDLIGPERQPYQQEPFTLVVRITYDPAFFRAWGAPLFKRALDLPFQITLPWGEVDPTVAGTDGARIAFNDDVVVASRTGEVVREGRVFEMIEVRKRCAESVDFPAPVLRFAYATTFEDDFFGDRRAIDRRDQRVEGQPLRVEVKPLPREGRPAAFENAVGRFTFDVETIGRGRVVMRIGGEGNLETLTPPRLESGPGLHVLGRLDAFEDGVRMVTWDVEAEREEVPRIRFAYFDPTDEGTWRELSSGAEALPAPAPPSPAALEATWPRLVLISLGLLLVGAAGIALLRRGLGGEQGGRRPAVAPPPPDLDPEQALMAYAAAFLDRPVAAMVDDALEDRLREAGMEAALAARLGGAIRSLIASRYGGAAPDEARISELRRTLGTWKGSA